MNSDFNVGKRLINLFIALLVQVNLASQVAAAGREMPAKLAPAAPQTQDCLIGDPKFHEKPCTFNEKSADRELMVQAKKAGKDCYCVAPSGKISYGLLPSNFPAVDTESEPKREDSELGNADWQRKPRPARNGTTK